MKNAVYAIIVGVVLIMSFWMIEQNISMEIIYATAILVGLSFISLLIVQFILPQNHKSILLLQALFMLLLFIPVYMTSTEELMEPTTRGLARFIMILVITYLILLVTVIFSVKYYFNRVEKFNGEG